MAVNKGLNITNSSESNEIVIPTSNKVRGEVKVMGESNTIVAESGLIFNADIRIEGNGNKIFIGKNCAIRGQILVKGTNQTVYIGYETTFQSVYILCQEQCDVFIGHHCMFSRNVEIRTTDAHSVIDLSTGERVNKPKSVNIGDHVWVGVKGLISKGGKVPSDSIVGANSFVNSSFDEENVILAGAPAKVVKRGVTWHRSRKQKFSEDEMSFWKNDL
ncbi:acyltransferase [Salinicola lusitanus]|uniref:acyltransferase n=1 Tax=Salinicola lusitanus TaxID=1949085 RepID=UPI0013006338|nr:acyltransferase [Salinicola lusitanus]